MVPKKRILLALLIIFGALRLLALAEPATPLWDESVYLSMGKFIGSAGEYGLYEPTRPLLLPLVGSLLWLGGGQGIFLSKLFTLFTSLALIFMVYLLGKEIFDENVGIIASALLAITPVFFSHSTVFYTAIPSLVLSLIGIFFYMHQRYILTGIFVALASTVSFTQMLLAIILIGFLFLDYIAEIDLRFIQSAATIGMAYVLTLIPYFLLSGVLVGDALKPLFEVFATKTYAYPIIQNTLREFAYYLVEPLLINIGLVFGLYFLYYYISRDARLSRNQFLIASIFIAFLILFTAIDSKQMEFIIFLLPFFVLLAGKGLVLAYDRVAVVPYRALLASIVLVIIVLQTGLHNVQSYEEVVAPGLTEFDTYFLNQTGVVLTSHPRPAVYGNQLYVPIYQSIDTAWDAYKTYPDAQGIQFIPETYGCNEEEVCAERVQEFFNTLKRERTLVFNETVYGRAHYIFT